MVFNIYIIVEDVNGDKWIPYETTKGVKAAIEDFYYRILIPTLQAEEYLEYYYVGLDNERVSARISKYYVDERITLIEGKTPFEIILKVGNELVTLHIQQSYYQPFYNIHDKKTHTPDR